MTPLPSAEVAILGLTPLWSNQDQKQLRVWTLKLLIVINVTRRSWGQNSTRNICPSGDGCAPSDLFGTAVQVEGVGGSTPAFMNPSGFCRSSSDSVGGCLIVSPLHGCRSAAPPPPHPAATAEGGALILSKRFVS